MKRVLLSVAVCALVATVAVAQTRPVRVPDLIGLGLFGSDAHNGGFYDVHVASPDRARVAVVVQRGNMTRNTVEYALLVFDSTALRRAGNPDTVLLWNAASNDPAISSLQWLADNRTIAFLGARPGDVAQVYTVDVLTRKVTARTRSATGVTSFQIGRLGDPVIYQEQARVDTADYSAMRAHGFVVDNRVYPSDVIGGDWRGVRRAAGVAPGYRIMRGGREAALVFPDSTDGYRDCGVDSYLGPPLSPAGDALMITCSPLAPRPVWAAYRNARYRLFADRYSAYGQEWRVLDLATGHSTLVVDAPSIPQSETNFAWAPDGRSIMISTALLPLRGPDSAQRVTHRMAAEIDLQSGRITVVAPDSLIVRGWDPRTGVVEFARHSAWFNVNDRTPRIYFQKRHGRWGRVSAPRDAAIRVVLDQGPNQPPRLVVSDSALRPIRTLLDPNPGLFAERTFGRVELFHWATKGGNVYVGGLYYPPDYVPGRRYPLVLQTHGFDSTAFLPDGVFTTGAAAQPLASAGIVVLQGVDQVAGDKTGGWGTPEEGPMTQGIIEAAIDSLDHRGLIDRNKVAMEGFSRTCFSTLYFLTHSSYPIAAADVTDGVDFSYMQYLVYHGGSDDENMNSGRPWGETHAHWLERAPGFRLDRIKTPMRLTAIGPHTVLQEWEPYAGLLAQGKPAELVYIPDGSHILVKPWERMTSQQGAVDWYRFWLQGYEDPDSSKADQYARWRRMRAQRDSTTAQSTQ